MTIKLTQAQRSVLEEAVRDGSFFCVESYPPARRLLALGYVTRREGKFGTGKLEPTVAGRAALSSQHHGNKGD